MADVVLRALEKFYSDQPIVKSIELDIRDGEFFSLLGPSGCGKTTSLRMIAGLETPTAGEIFIGGHRMNDTPINKRPTNMVFQKHALFPHLNVFDNIAFGLKLKKLSHNEITRNVTEILDVVNLSGSEHRRVNELSGGQQQRVAIARALVNEPAVLLLDEPLGALDLKLQLRLQHELKRIQRATGTTFIYVTHNQAEALSLSDRVAVMNNGVIEQIGTPEDLYLRPATSFVASFIGQTNLINAQVSEHAGVVTCVTEDNFSLQIGILPETPVGSEVLLSLRPERISIITDMDVHTGVANSVNATVSEIEFLGANVLYRMQLEEGRQLQVLSLANAPFYNKGQSVRLQWDLDAAVPIRTTSMAEDVE